MKFELEPNITKTYLLEQNSQETYLSYYLGIPVKKGLFKSPLRNDAKPTCAFYTAKNGDIIFKDFSGAFQGNFIAVVMHKKNCNYHMALKIIANDFGFIKLNNVPKTNKPIRISKEKFEETKEAVIQIKQQDFTDNDLKWWKQYGVTKDTLKKFNVFSCDTVFLNGNIFARSNKAHPIYGYYRGKNNNNNELWRIYFPQHRSKEPKFLSNWKAHMMQGAQQLPQTADCLVVTKSMKDVMLLYELGIPAIAPNSETLFLTDIQYIRLKERFKNIIVFYDNDQAGIENLNKIRKNFKDVICCWIPQHYGAKDLTDFYKAYGHDKTVNLINEAKEKIKRKCKSGKIRWND